MPPKRYLTAEEKSILDEEFYGVLGVHKVSKKVKITYYIVKTYWLETFGKQAVKDRCSRLNRYYKLGSKNPMFGKIQKEHHNFKEYKLCSSGYRLTSKPDWYQGRSINNSVHEHILVYCACNNLMILPKGYVIHHIDNDKLNNNPSNLVLLSVADHMKLHMNFNEGATTIP